ncbi:MAG: lysine--tRNA ligase [Archaeoglobus sp.]|nr:MAG: lysine--tRNA ligase [Archaeoglobus sp.]
MHWADKVAEELLRRGDKHRIATGITPSGHIHLGNLREMLTADAVRRALEDRGGKVKIIYIADTFDPLRKRYPFLPAEYDKYVGMPLSRIPCPCGEHKNYAEHFLEPFLESLKILGIDVEVKRADRMYKEGEYEKAIKIALREKEKIKKILEEVTGKKCDESWSPFMPICENCGRINSTKVTGFNEKHVHYVCECGHEGEVSYREGKLGWRIDWPARWGILNITCEPMGKDHAAAGGSYDTGKRLAREVFEIEPPYPVVYEWIHLKGVGAMKSSKGVVVPVREMVEVLPPEIVRYIIIRSKPERHIDFDPATLLDLIDEFEEAYTRKDRSVELSLVEKVNYCKVPFRHLVVVGQIANWNFNRVIEILRRTEYDVDVEDVKRRMSYAKKWLEKFAPERMKFEVRDIKEINVDFSKKELEFLRKFAEEVKNDMKADDLHNLVYVVASRVGIKPAKAFNAIYKAVLGKNYGPRAGYFMESLGTDWIKKRFIKVVELRS